MARGRRASAMRQRARRISASCASALQPGTASHGIPCRMGCCVPCGELLLLWPYLVWRAVHSVCADGSVCLCRSCRGPCTTCPCVLVVFVRACMRVLLRHGVLPPISQYAPYWNIGPVGSRGCHATPRLLFYLVSLCLRGDPLGDSIKGNVYHSHTGLVARKGSMACFQHYPQDEGRVP